MKRSLDEGTVNAIFKTLFERFGEPIGKAVDIGPGVPDESDSKLHKGTDSENNGFGTKFESSICESCGCMAPQMVQQDTCESCGMMDEGLPLDAIEASKKNIDPKDPRTTKDALGNVTGTWKGKMEPKSTKPKEKKVSESEMGGKHPGHASSCTCPDCMPHQDLEEKAPPGREKQVKALKKNKDVDNPFAVAWASYNKSNESIEHVEPTIVSSAAQPLYYEIIDSQTKAVVGKARTAVAAKKSVDRRDNAYGGYRFRYKPVYATT